SASREKAPVDGGLLLCCRRWPGSPIPLSHLPTTPAKDSGKVEGGREMKPLNAASILPDDGTKGTLVGRVWLPQARGPAVVAVRADGVYDVTESFPTVSALVELPNPANALRGVAGVKIGSLDDVAANVAPDSRDSGRPWLLAPLDLQVLKAAGVTFVVS